MKRALIISLLLSLINVISVSADSKNSNINISARVLPFIKYEIIHQEKNLVITANDISRGFIDIQRAMIFSVRTNSSNGYQVVFSAGSDFIREATVFNERNSYSLSGSGGELFFPYQGTNYTTKELSIRFYLLSDAKPGVYEWPLSFLITVM